MPTQPYSDEVKIEDMRHLVAGSTHYLGHGLYALRCQSEDGELRNYLLGAPAFEHLRRMIETSLLDARDQEDYA